SLSKFYDLSASAEQSLTFSHLRKGPGIRMRNRRFLSLGAMVLGAALTGFHYDATRICGERKAGVASTDREVAIRLLDTNGMQTLLGRRGGRRRPLALYLFYTDCRPCTDRLGDIERLYDEYRDKGLDVALVSIAPMDDRPKLLDLLGRINAHI